jgi:hypothetical protein
MMKRMAVLAAAAVLAIGTMGETIGVRAASLSNEAGSVQVTVTYKGKGTVDASHQLWVWLFDTPEIGAGAMPIGQMSLDKNGATATFEAAADKVWIAVAYDESGTMAGMAPPPSGTPIGIHASATGAPEAVATGDKKPIVVTFDDSQRMP